MNEPSYPAARRAAATVQAHFARHLAMARGRGLADLAFQPDAAAIEAIIDAAFWASLRREEGHDPRISLAFLPPEQAGPALMLERPLSLAAAPLARLAPAVERPGIHLGVWRQGSELVVWGTTRAIPTMCFVLEVVSPGVLVVKHRRGTEAAKFVNVAVLEGNQLKVLDERGASLPECPSVLAALLGFDGSSSDALNVLVELAVSMRAHGRGGALLVVPSGSPTWLESIVQPISYAVSPPYTELSRLVLQEDREASGERLGPGGGHPGAHQGGREWQDALHRAVDVIAGLTAVDGATILTTEYEVLAFGAKIARRKGSGRVEQVVVTEPIEENAARTVHPTEFGGTRHLSAAQFVQDQHDAVAYVASQDGRFTIFAWSERDGLVHARRVESLLL